MDLFGRSCCSLFHPISFPKRKARYQRPKKTASGPKCPVTGMRIQGVFHLKFSHISLKHKTSSVHNVNGNITVAYAHDASKTNNAEEKLQTRFQMPRSYLIHLHSRCKVLEEFPNIFLVLQVITSRYVEQLQEQLRIVVGFRKTGAIILQNLQRYWLPPSEHGAHFNKWV